MKFKLLAVFLIFAVVVLVSTDIFADEWSTYGHDFQRTGQSGAGIDPNRLTRMWMFSHPSNAITFTGSFATNDSLIFLAMSDAFGSDGRGDIVALRKSDGTQKWTFDSLRSGTGGRTSITLQGGRLYFGAGAGNTFRCVDALTGTQIWAETLTTQARFAASVIIPIVADTVIFFGDEGGNLYALKTSDGSNYVSWVTNPVSLGGVITNSVSSRNDTLFVGTSQAIPADTGTVYAIDAKTGTVLWSFTSTFGGIISAPVVTSIGITVATYWPNDAAGVFGRIFTLNEDGTALWGGTGGVGATAFYSTPAAAPPPINRVVMGFTDAGIRVRSLTNGGTVYSAGTHGIVRTPFAMSSDGYFAFNDDQGYWYLYKSNPGIGESSKKLEYAEFATQVYALTGFAPIGTAISSSPDTQLFMGEVYGNVFGFSFSASPRPRTVAASGGLPLTINIIPGDSAKTETHTMWYNTGNATLTYSGLTAASTPALGSALYRISKVSPKRQLLADNLSEELTSISIKGFISNNLRNRANVNLDESYFATMTKSEFIVNNRFLTGATIPQAWLSVTDVSSTPGSIPTGDSIVADIKVDPTGLTKGIYSDGFIYVDGSNDPDPQLYTCPPAIPGTECRAFQQVIFLLAFPDQGNYLVTEGIPDTVAQLFVTNYGAIADYQGNPGIGSSWYGADDILFDGTILVGTDATDMAGDFGFTLGRGYGDQMLAGSFLAESTFYQPSGLDSILVRTAAGTAFTNTGISVDVNMEAVAMSKAGLNEMILFKYDFINTGLSTLTNLYTGLHLDFDVYNGTASTANIYQNMANVSNGFYFQYVRNGTQDTLMGVMPLEMKSQPRTFRGVNNGVYIHPNAGFAWAGPPFDELLALMDSAGVYIRDLYDLSSLFTFDKADLAAGETTTVIFALGMVIDSTITLPDTVLGGSPASVIGDAARRYRRAAGFDRGDVTSDGKITSADIVYLINYYFKLGPAPVPFLFMGDVNINGKVSTGDIVYLINYYFKGKAAPLGAWAW